MQNQTQTPAPSESKHAAKKDGDYFDLQKLSKEALRRILEDKENPDLALQAAKYVLENAVD